MTSILPPFPRFVFTIFEPLALMAGWVSPTFDTVNFVRSQLPSTDAEWPNSTTHVLALQLGNVYGLLAMISIGILYTTSEPKVVRNFLLACAVADVGHLCVTFAAMGYNDFVNVQGWNAMGWGNIGVTAGLFLTRVLYLVGAFGEDGVIESTKAAVKKCT